MSRVSPRETPSRMREESCVAPESGGSRFVCMGWGAGGVVGEARSVRGWSRESASDVPRK